MRQISSSAYALEGEVTSTAEFASKVAVKTNFDPAFPTDFLKGTTIAVTEGQPTPNKMKLSFVLPHKILMSEAEVRRTC